MPLGRRSSRRRATVIVAGVALIIGSAWTTVSPARAAPSRCNGSVHLCERPVGDVAFATTHNSMSSAADGFRGPNQGAAISEQLRSGIRGFQIDTYPGIQLGSRVLTNLAGPFGAQATDLPRRS